MRVKTLKRISLISILIIAALVVSLVAVTFLTDTQPKAQAAAGTLYTAEYQGDNGTLDGQHYDRNFIAAKYGVSTSQVFSIASGLELYKFLNGEYSSYKVGFLTRDVAIAYNASVDGYDTISENSSAAIFDDIFDGNGYTVKIYGGAGEANSTVEIEDDYDYRLTYRDGNPKYDNNGNYQVWYEYTGFLVAQNYGTIANFTIDYTSPHNVIEAVKVGDLKITTANRLLSKREGVFVAGIVAGLNGYGGVIDNLKINVKNAFTVVKQNSADKDGGVPNKSAGYAGGIAGRIEDNSKINNCWVDLAYGAGVSAGAEGRVSQFPATDNNNTFAVAGGIVGNIDTGTAQLTYCALSGSGQVKAFANRGSNDSKFRAYSGGIAGGCIRFTGTSTKGTAIVVDCNSDTNVRVKSGQIKGIISSWTGSRFTNFNNNPKESMGSLFDAVGSDDEIESLAILFNLETLMDNNPTAHKPTSTDGKLVLDSSGNLRNWLEIHPASEGGTMGVMFDTDNSNYDIRIHIIADGHDEFKNSGVMNNVDMSGSARYYQYKMREGDGGGFIWSGTFSNANDSSNHISLALDDPIYAEIYMISSTNTGSYNYEFGRMGILEYSDTNGNNGVKPYNGTADPLKLPSVSMTNYPAFDTSVFTNENLWNISRSGKNVSLSQTYMPGTYSMRVETKLGERSYGYYNETERMLAWQPSADYVFTILQGVLSFGNRTTTADGWQDQVTFELTMNSASDFDSIEFQRNGEFPSNSTEGFTRSGASAFYTVTETTGKNGTAYTFYAYKRDAVTEENVVVAISESRTVRIDREAPEVSEIEYYMVEDGGERLLSDEDLEYIQEHWTKNQILAKFSVSDNGKSGIAIAATGNNIEETVLNNNGDREVVVTINDSKPLILEYTDARGHTTPVKLQVNIDRVEGRLSFSGSSYRTEGRFNYSTKNVSVRYVANFGMSGWRMYYSYQRDAQGEDIWIASPDLLTDSGAVKTFTIDWNMGNINTGLGDDFKIKMVNEAGLYEEEVFPTDARGDRLPNDVIGNYIIWLRVANIYLDTNLNNIFVNDGGNVLSVEEILKSEEDKAKYFDKQYDGTDEYAGKKNYQFYTDLSALNKYGFYFNEKLGVIYSPSGIFLRSPIDLGENGIVPVEMRYTSTEVGDSKLSFQVVLTGVDGYNYIVYFTDLSGIDFEEDVEVEEGTYWESIEIDVKITKREVVIDLDSQEAFSSAKQYYYGDDVPNAIDVYVESTGEYISVKIETKASSTANIDEYDVKGISPSGYGNIEYIINPTTIVINPRPVAVDLRFDGGSIGNIPTGIKAGKVHSITGTYQDVNGEEQKANIEYVLNNKPVNSLSIVGLYTINITLSNNNYVIDGQKSFKFSIARGQLDIETGVRIKDYTEEQVEYDLVIDKEAKDQGLYSDSDLKVTYYEYLEGAVYNSVTQKIEGKVSDYPMSEYPTDRGLYLVRVEFVTKDNPNFFPKSDYAEGYLVIVSAETTVNVEKVVLEYSYTAEKFTYDLVDAVAEVRSSSNKQLWSASMAADGIVKVQYKDTDGSFVDVASSPNEGGGWYSETGRYEYRVSYNGNDDYNESSIDVVMIINEAELKGITFNSVEAVYDGKSHVPTVNGLFNYTGLEITFRHGVTQIYCDGTNANEAIKELNLVDAREYTVTMVISKEGYATKEYQTKVVIKKAQMEGVTASLLDVVYDGNRHDVTFLGLKYEDNGSMTYNGESVIISSGNSEGNAYATNVYIEPGVGPSYYTGEVTLRSANYEDLVLKTQITIRQALLPYQEISKTLPNKVPSGMSLSGYKGYFVDTSGRSVECTLQYRKYLKGNEDKGEIVTPDENGVIADGRYTVWIVIPNDNFYIDRYWTVDVGEINSAEISTVGWVAIGAVVVLMAAAAITAVVVVKKRKKAGIV
ncbi:MAG: hypothetical protein K2K85_03870 [Clostridia bacterium]|nr:hypothetical protein [Clostridia bacterium]